MPVTVVKELNASSPIHNLEQIKMELKEDGALRIRGEELTPYDFEHLSDQFMQPLTHHATNTIERDAVNTNTTTSTVNKGKDAIPFHRELSYAPSAPDLLMFYCIQPAREGGETTICDGTKLLETLPREIRDFVEAAELTWSWDGPPERWQAMLGVKAKEEAIQKLEFLQKTLPPYEQLNVHFAGDILKGTFQTKCVIPTRWGNHLSFCNSLLIYHFRQASEYYARGLFKLTLGDGSPFPLDMLKVIAACADDITYEVKWQTHDIVIVDNSRCMHGRRAFVDPERKVLIRMGHIGAAL